MKAIQVTLKILLGFLSLTAIGGGAGMITGIASPPDSLLEGTMFDSYMAPGLILLLAIGGSSVIAFVLLLKNHESSKAASYISATLLILFIIAENLVIGSPEGIINISQIGYLFIGMMIIFYTSMLSRVEDDINLGPLRRNKRKQ